MAKQDKIYCGSGKKQNKDWLTATLNLEVLQEHSYEYKGKTLVNVSINIYEKPNEYGKDVGVTINEYNPKLGAKNRGTTIKEDFVDDNNSSDLPF